LAIYSANSLNRALFPATLTLEKETYRMKRLILAFGLSMMLSGCVTATLATAVVALPVKAVGAAAKAITPDGEESDEKGDESD